MAFIQFQFRSGTTFEWADANPILAIAEIGIETDTKQFKIGDGNNNWNQLPYGGIDGPRGFTGSQGITGYIGSQGDIGYTGSRAYTGSQGIQGNDGFIGSQGIQGSVGFTGSKGGFADWIFLNNLNNGYQSSNLESIIADTTISSFSIVLPSSPQLGDVVTIVDAGDFSINNLAVLRNGSTIENQESDFLLDIGQGRYEFVYSGATWQIVSNMGGNSGLVGFTGSRGNDGDVTLGKAIAMALVFK